MESFSKKIKELRKQSGYTQKELSDILNVAYSTISMWERNERTPDFGMLVKLSETFGVSTDELLLGDKPKKSEKLNEASYDGFDEIIDYLEVLKSGNKHTLSEEKSEILKNIINNMTTKK